MQYSIHLERSECMKVNTHVQYLGREINMAELERKIKDIWKENGGLVKDLNEIDLYMKVEENKCYYVINGSDSGAFAVEA